MERCRGLARADAQCSVQREANGGLSPTCCDHNIVKSAVTFCAVSNPTAMSAPVLLSQRHFSSKPVNFGNSVLRSSLALVLFWIGGMKFTAYEASGIQGLIATSPLMSWMYHFLSVQAASNVIGVAELTIAVLILLRPLSARA